MACLIAAPCFPRFPPPLIGAAGNFGVSGNRRTPFSGTSGNFGASAPAAQAAHIVTTGDAVRSAATCGLASASSLVLAGWCRQSSATVRHCLAFYTGARATRRMPVTPTTDRAASAGRD